MAVKIKIFGGRASHTWPKRSPKATAWNWETSSFQVFSDGEFQPSFEENIRGNDVFIVQSTFPPTENLFELLMLVDAAKRASAKNIVAVMPYFGYARQDRKDKPRVSIASKLVANLLVTAGVTRIITLDLHADQIQGFFDVPVDHLYASSIFIPYIKELNLENLTFASPDVGRHPQGRILCQVFPYRLRDLLQAALKTQRDRQNGPGGRCGRPRCDPARRYHRYRRHPLQSSSRSSWKTVPTAVRAMVTHPILSGKAIENIK